MGEFILLHARFQLLITFSRIRLKKEKIKGNFMVFPSVDCIDEFMSRNNYASLLHIRLRAGARFSKVPIINGPVKLLLFSCKIEVSIVLHLT